MKSDVIEFFYLAVLVFTAELRLTFVLESKILVRLLCGVRVRMQRQNPCFRQQRPRKAEQQKQGNVGTQGLHNTKVCLKQQRLGLATK